MKVSYQWLNQYLPLEEKGIQPAALAEKLARTSVDINDVYSPMDGLKKLVVGLVVACEPHPDSDHLNVCQVQVSETETLQIVCGAPNVQVGKKVIVALVGARIKDNIKIKRGKIRGVESNGMLCALQEIGFSEQVAPKDYEAGIWFLPDDAVVGDAVYPYLGMDDTIIDTDLTPNRGDMLSIFGNVNDLAAIYDLPNGFESHPVVESDEAMADQLSATLADEAIAPAYEMRLIKHLHVADSPMWLQIKLWNAGIRPINNVVDITNYILLKYGQPLHAFDYAKLPSHQITVRHAQAGEQLTTLDGETRSLQASDIVIAAGEEAVALAGTMGGQSTMVDEQTTSVALEAAIFDPVMVRKQARRLDLHSESSMRFERGINPETLHQALDEAAYWLAELAGGQVVAGKAVAARPQFADREITLSVRRVNHVLGTELTMAMIEQLMVRLDFAAHSLDDDQLVVAVPARRWDIELPADLYEEIARLYGYDNLPSTLPAMTKTAGGLTETQARLRASRHTLEGLGLTQAISYSLTTVKRAQQFRVAPDQTQPMQLDYPMSSDHVATRMSIISGLLLDVAYNHARKVADVALYEQGRVFIPQGGERPLEEEHVAGAVTGHLTPANWHQAAQPVDFYALKGIVQTYLQNLAVAGEITYVADSSRPEMHPGRTANILLDGQVVGFLGQVHPSCAAEYKIPETYVFELNLAALLAAPKRDKHYVHISKYPAVTRDIALLVDQTITNQAIVAAIKQKGGAYLKQVQLFDLYRGEHLPANKKSLAYTLTYQADDATLKEDDVNQAFEKVVAHLTTTLGAEIR
ncbi:phenylalanine--tRNA ligase subunit beta [Limosilactobacillus ingluviei]|uniref:phenylalanine--tRNA ligase subunit beta n=1 Tax=Limosilactobacillus ingluviei TaxID=148604 RepID=UPI0023F4AF67|nr:phenylalanine--tRNA ligase subunit beta [Limosilactobacillus ingluviei]